jgi:hypothetical protein
VFKKKPYQSTWSPNMVKQFRERFVEPILPGKIFFVLNEKVTTISFDVNMLSKDSSYLGTITMVDEVLDDVCFGLSFVDDLSDEHKNYIGYIEILNGSLGSQSVPMIRGFMRKDSIFLESINSLLIESKIFNLKELFTIQTNVNISSLKDISDDQILNKTLPIKSVEIYHRVSII